MPMVQVGALWPLIGSRKVNGGLNSLPVYEGLNTYGRSDSALFNKAISRKHICITFSPESFFEITVVGSNPIVVLSGSHRMKLLPNSTWRIEDGDVIEFLPSAIPFRFVQMKFPAHSINVPTLDIGGSCNTKQKVNLVHKVISSEDRIAGKRKCQLDGDKEEKVGYARATFVSSSMKGMSTHFNVNLGTLNSEHTDDTRKRTRHISASTLCGSTFQLIHTENISSWANKGCIRIHNIIEGNIQLAILSSYMVDVPWLLSACPSMQCVQQVVMIHGENGESLESMQATKPKNWILYKPPLRIAYGTHHSKAMLLVYRTGVRIVVHTANLIQADWNNKTQGLWMQDFPWKMESMRDQSSEFENDLVEYLEALEWSGCNVFLPDLGEVRLKSSFFRKFNYSSASVRLVASVPGFHRDSSIMKWGHMKLRSILQQENFDSQFQGSPLVYQFSSLGSLDERWINELTTSMSAGLTTDGKPLGLGDVRFVWPTVNDIRCSNEGYTAGSSVPSPYKNVRREFLTKYWAQWKAGHCGRDRVMPHIKTFVRYNGQSLAWFLLTSSNLSKAAWGSLQKNNTQLMIRSYELGVCFLPSHVLKSRTTMFSCCGNPGALENFSWCPPLLKDREADREAEESSPSAGTLVTTSYDVEHEDKFPCTLVRFPIPYTIPPPLYACGDVPWSWDQQYSQPDMYGRVWP